MPGAMPRRDPWQPDQVGSLQPVELARRPRCHPRAHPREDGRGDAVDVWPDYVSRHCPRSWTRQNRPAA